MSPGSTARLARSKALTSWAWTMRPWWRVIQDLNSSDFDKSMTSIADHRIWQDVYKPRVGDRTLYVKFTLDARQAWLFDQFQGGVDMTKTPRDYPETMISAESGRPMTRGEKRVTFRVEGHVYSYNQPGWWCSLTDPDDTEGQLVDGDNQVAEMARRTAKALAHGERVFVPVVIRAIRQRCGLTQREAGIAFGAGEKAFEKYESGEIAPSAPTKRVTQVGDGKPGAVQAHRSASRRAAHRRQCVRSRGLAGGPGRAALRAPIRRPVVGGDHVLPTRSSRRRRSLRFRHRFQGLELLALDVAFDTLAKGGAQKHDAQSARVENPSSRNWMIA